MKKMGEFMGNWLKNGAKCKVMKKKRGEECRETKKWKDVSGGNEIFA